MLRGYIERVTGEVVGGWIYVESAALEGKLILAFLDGVCVGAGRVGIFRQDLFDAGLGDGKLGFEIPISMPDEHARRRLIVKLDGSDGWLIQPGAAISAKGAGGNRLDSSKAADRLTSYKWMLGRNWLSQSDYDFLKTMLQIGVYERGVPAVSAKRDDPAHAQIAELLSVLYQNNVSPREKSVASAASLIAEIRELGQTTRSEYVVCLMSPAPFRIRVVEGSHHEGYESADSAGGIDYEIVPNRALFLDVRCVVSNPNLVKDPQVLLLDPEPAQS